MVQAKNNCYIKTFSILKNELGTLKKDENVVNPRRRRRFRSDNDITQPNNIPNPNSLFDILNFNTEQKDENVVNPRRCRRFRPDDNITQSNNISNSNTEQKDDQEDTELLDSITDELCDEILSLIGRIIKTEDSQKLIKIIKPYLCDGDKDKWSVTLSKLSTMLIKNPKLTEIYISFGSDDSKS